MRIAQSTKSLLTTSVAVLSLACAFIVLHPNKASAEYSGGMLISDAVFLDAKAMSRHQIQDFLESKGSGLATKSYKLNCYESDSQEREWYTAAGAPCDQTVLASYIIYYAAQVYGINPQAILATLQKEQSLITSPNPTSWQQNQAMGYGCPTTGRCSGGSNFFYQIDSGVWVMRWHYERASGNTTWWSPSTTWTCGTEKNFYKPSLHPRQDVRFYDEDDVHYRTHYIHNAATSSMYCYTPHAYNNPKGLYGLPKYGTKGRYYTGSYNFVKFFELWFGSTEGTPFFKVSGGNKTYILGSDNRYYYVPDYSLLRAYGYPGRINTIATKPSNYLSGKVDAGVLTKLARFESGDEYLGVYLMDSGERHHFTTAGMITDVYGYDRGQEESHLPVSTAAFYPKTSNVKEIIKSMDGSLIYLMENGLRRRIIDLDAFRTGDPIYSSRPYVRLTSEYMSLLKGTYPVLGLNKLIRTYDTGSYKFWNGGYLFNISRTTIEQLGLKPDYNLRSSEVGNLPRYTSAVGVLVKNHGNYYLLDDSRKLNIPSSQLASYGLVDADFVTTPSKLLGRVKTEGMSRLVMVSGSNSKYLIKNKQLDHFSDKRAVAENGFSYSQLKIITRHSASAFPKSGKLVLPTGTKFKIEGQGQTYIINAPTTKLYIESSTMMSQYGFKSSQVMTFTAQQVSGYSTAGTLGHITKDSSGNIWLIHSGGKSQYISTGLAAPGRFDINASNLKSLSKFIYSQTSNAGPLKKLLRDRSNNRIYYVENGQKRWVTSSSAVSRLGYTYNDISIVSHSFINSLPSGENID